MAEGTPWRMRRSKSTASAHSSGRCPAIRASGRCYELDNRLVQRCVGPLEQRCRAAPQPFQPEDPNRPIPAASMTAPGCGECGGPIEPSTSPRGGRPRQYCLTCRPSKTAERRTEGPNGHRDDSCAQCGTPLERSARKAGRPRIYCDGCRGRRFRTPRSRQRDEVRPTDPCGDRAAQAAAPETYRDRQCAQCGAPIDHSGQRRGRPRIYCDACYGRQVHTRQRRPRPLVGLRFAEIFGEPTDRAGQEVLERLFDMAHIGGWSVETLRRKGDQLRRVLAATGEEKPIRLSQVRAELGNIWQSRIVARLLDQCGLLVDDTESPTRQWVDRRTATLPAGFRDDVRAWLLVLHEGEERARPRAEATLHAYFSRAHPPLTEWASTRSHLREITQADVSAVLNRLTGHKRIGTFVALRSLFQFAERHHLIFVDPTRRLRVGTAPSRVLLPMTDDQVDAVTAMAVTPMQRVIVGLVAVYAVRANPLRNLVLDDVDLSRRRIRIGGTVHQLTEFTHDVLTDWLTYRQHRWPGTLNPHVIVSTDSVFGTSPVTDHHLTWHLGLLGVELERIRGDRVLQEALSTNADPCTCRSRSDSVTGLRSTSRCSPTSSWWLCHRIPTSFIGEFGDRWSG